MPEKVYQDQKKQQASTLKHETTQQQSKATTHASFVDQSARASKAVQLKAMMNNSSQVQQAAQLKAMMNSSPQTQKITQLQETADQSASNKTGLPDQLKSGVEKLSGYSMDDVKVHRNSSKPAQLQAHAYAQGTDIHLGSGQEKHLPHEAWHVVQQKQGRVKPTTSQGGTPVNDNQALEKEADVMGAKATKTQSSNQQLETTSTPDNNPVQRKIGKDGNVIFGLSGKDRTAIENAVDAGYTTFDAADTYGDTIGVLAKVLKEKGVERSNYEIIYKVAATAPNDVFEHVKAVATGFEGFLDHVMIHKVTEEARANDYWSELKRLKDEGFAKAIGAGDIQAGMEKYMAESDSFEVDAAQLLGPDGNTLVEQLKASKDADDQPKPVFVYNILHYAKEVFGVERVADVSSIQLKMLIWEIQNLVPGAEPILSSKKAETQKKNLAITEEPSDEEYNEMGPIKDQLDKRNAERVAEVSMRDMLRATKEKIASFIDNYQWEEQPVKKGSKEFKDEDYEKEMRSILGRFTKEELAIVYQDPGSTTNKSCSLQTLIEMLFDKTGNCHRVAAFNFIQTGFALSL